MNEERRGWSRLRHTLASRLVGFDIDTKCQTFYRDGRRFGRSSGYSQAVRDAANVARRFCCCDDIDAEFCQGGCCTALIAALEDLSE